MFCFWRHLPEFERFNVIGLGWALFAPGGCSYHWAIGRLLSKGWQWVLTRTASCSRIVKWIPRANHWHCVFNFKPRPPLKPSVRRTLTWPLTCGRTPCSPRLLTRSLQTSWQRTTRDSDQQLLKIKPQNSKMLQVKCWNKVWHIWTCLVCWLVLTLSTSIFFHYVLYPFLSRSFKILFFSDGYILVWV